MRILIATPTTQGTVRADYVHSLMSVLTAANTRGVSFGLMTIDSVGVAMARNALAHSFLADPDNTHILFLDSDMAVAPAVIEHMIGLDKPVVGALYPERNFDLSAYARAIAEDPDEQRAAALASNFVVRLPAGQLKIRHSMIEVEGFGFGCVLIARGVFERLIKRKLVEARDSRRYARKGLRGPVYGFFDELRFPDGESRGEDYSFCARVLKLKNVPLLAYIGGGVGHVGSFTHNATFMDFLKTQTPITPVNPPQDPP